MKIFLLNVHAGRRPFYSDGLDEAEVERRTGRLGWITGLEEWLYRLKERWLHADGRATQRVRRVRNWLRRFRHPDEQLLIHLRSASVLEIRYPATLTPDEARAAWEQYLKSRLSRHFFWLAFNLLLVPVTVLLALLPGPNIIGYWFAYRAVHHFLVLLGLRRALRGEVPTSFEPSEALDVPWEEAERNGDPHPALGSNPKHLDEFLQRPAERAVK